MHKCEQLSVFLSAAGKGSRALTATERPQIVAQSRKNCHVTAHCHSIWEIQMEFLHCIDMEICHRSLGIVHLTFSATKLASMQCSGGGIAQVAAILISMPTVSSRGNMNETWNSKRFKSSVLLLDHSVLACYHCCFLMQNVLKLLKFLEIFVMTLSLALGNQVEFFKGVF